MQKQKPVNITDFLNITSGLFEEKKIKNPRLNAEILLSGILNCSRLDLYMNFEKPLTEAETDSFRTCVRRRLNHEPLQYITGKTSFYGLEFEVNRDVLIPRQETELLVERILDDIRIRKLKKAKIFEIGTGSGCISISVAKNLQMHGTDYEIMSVDVSENAVKTAGTNLELNGLDNGKVRFLVQDIFKTEKLPGKFDYIISNPPYISLKDYESLDSEVREYEPRLSLTDNGSGLKFYERIFRIGSDIDFSGKIFCEIGFGQKDEIEKIINGYNYKKHAFYKDYSEIYRIAEAEK
ncbi:MAG: peptide chain release factor N(5)-glutamine methyltransferase [Ignavibacteria bacterium]|nr:peptide chain release factor N(5)-glutamine methyltransferase [Ignavibacteria bacterium]